MEATETDIKDFVADKVATYKQIQMVEFIDEIPKSASGKNPPKVPARSVVNTQETVVVTGANSGIGRSTALLLASKGYKVFATMRSLSRGEKLRALADELQLDILQIELDVGSDESVQEGFRQIFEESERIDVLSITLELVQMPQ